MPATATSYTENFATYPNGAPAGWTSIIGAGTTASLLGTLTVAGAQATFTGLTTNDHGAAVLNLTAGATVARVLTKFKFTQLRGGFNERGAGACLMFTYNAAAPSGFSGYRVFTDLDVSDGALSVQYQAYGATGTQYVNLSGALGTFAGLTTSTSMWLETEVYGPVDAQNRMKIRIRAWKDGNAVPAWAVDALVNEAMYLVAGYSGLASRGVSYAYLYTTINGNWPVYPTAPIITQPTGPTLVRGVHTLGWSASTDADASAGGITYTGERRINGGAYAALFTAQAGLTYAWNLSSAAGTTVQARVRATDGAGLLSDWAEGVVLTVAPLAAPSAPVVTAPVGPDLSRGTHTLAWTASVDPDAAPGGTVEYEGEYSASGGGWLPLFAWQGATSYEWDLFDFAGGTVQARVRARDEEWQVSAWDEGPVLTVGAWASCGTPPATAWSGCGAPPDTAWAAC